MIADKLLKSFYIVEVHGDACNSIITGNFGIEKIAFGSTDFDSDLSALSGLKKAIQFITSGEHLNLDNMTEEIVYNPEFFPSVKPLELTAEQMEDQEYNEALVEEIQDSLKDSDRQAVIMTRVFDDLGDFIETRWTVESPSFKIVGRVAVNPDAYIKQKGYDASLLRNELFQSTIVTQPALH